MGKSLPTGLAKEPGAFRKELENRRCTDTAATICTHKLRFAGLLRRAAVVQSAQHLVFLQQISPQTGFFLVSTVLLERWSNNAVPFMNTGRTREVLIYESRKTTATGAERAELLLLATHWPA